MSESRMPVRLVTGGDLELEKRIPEFASGTNPRVQAAFDYLRHADVCFMNCEMGIGRGGYRVDKLYNLHSDPVIAHELADLGVHIVTLANNHVMDFGYEGLFETLENIDSVGIARVGAGRSLEEAVRPHFRTVKGRRFAFLGASSVLPGVSAAGPDRPGIAPVRVITSYEVDPVRMAEAVGAPPVVRTRAVQEDVDRVIDAIVAARKEADHVIIAIHWGITRSRVTPEAGQIAEFQPPLGKAFVDAGVDMVVGSHSHNMLGIEVYRGKPIFYGLGNFAITPLDWNPPPTAFFEPESVIVLADFGESSLHVRLVPILANADGLPTILSGPERQRILDLLLERSKRFGTRYLIDEEGVEIQLDAVM